MQGPLFALVGLLSWVTLGPYWGCWLLQQSAVPHMRCSIMISTPYRCKQVGPPSCTLEALGLCPRAATVHDPGRAGGPKCAAKTRSHTHWSVLHLRAGTAANQLMGH